jgi:hypothetical protein
MYQRNLRTGELRFVATFADQGFGMGVSDSRIFQGSTPDGDHMVFYAPTALTPGAIEGGENFYDFSAGELHLVSVLPNGTATNASPIGPNKDRLKYNQVSADGSRVFFESGQALYVREDNTSTKLLSASQRAGADPTQPRGVGISWASADGSAAYFTAFGGGGAPGLTDDAPDFFGEGQGQLYRYDLDSGVLAYVGYGDDGPADTNFAERILAVSADGSTAYFSAGNTDGVTSSSDSPSNRLYVYRDGETHFVAEADAALQRHLAVAATSPSGRYFTFPGTDPGLVSPPATTCAGCKQIYVYDAEKPGQRLSCASCNPSGTVTSSTEPFLEAEENTGGYIPRALLDNGDMIFQSNDRLVPEDSNDKADIYRWNAGQLDLVSRGYGSENSFYGDVTPDGRSVFFYSGEHLVGQDVDDVQDLYVARVGGGLAAQNPPAAEPPCLAESCLDRSPAPPADIAPASNSFSGPANPKRAQPRKKCGKGRQLKKTKGKVRCVKRVKAGKGRGAGK